MSSAPARSAPLPGGGIRATWAGGSDVGQCLGRERRRRRGDAVVGVLGHERAVVARHLGREPPGEVVRLAAGVDEQHGVEAGLRRERREQALGELDERLREIPRVGRAEPRLADDRLGHPRVAVADDGDVVVGVEQAAPVRLVDPDALGAYGVDGARVGERGQESAERLVAPAGELVGSQPPGIAPRARGRSPPGQAPSSSSSRRHESSSHASM